MNKIKIIDLLNMISKGEEVPKYVQYYNMLKDKIDIMMVCKENIFYKLDQLEIQLNSRIEPLEEEKKITPNDFENLGYALGSIKKYINKGYDKAIEEKKIPEKLDVIGWDKCIHNVTHKEKELAIEINKTQKLLNQLIDYLKSKGE